MNLRKGEKKRGGKLARLSVGVKILCSLMTAGLICLPFGTRVYAAESGTYEEVAEAAVMARSGSEQQKLEYSLPGVSSKSIYAHSRMNTTVNGKTLSEPSLYINGITYMPMRSTLSALGVSNIRYDSGTRTMTARAQGFDMTVSDGAFVSYVNGRAFFSFSPAVIMSNGRMYLPASTLAKASGTAFSREGSVARLSGSFSPPISASKYYREDEVYWLSRIIYAESGGESLLGQIAVGDVILNRVRSTQFPNTIYGVIFDRKNGLQFSPVGNGTIYKAPSYTAVLAAKICLEGTSLSDNAMYFINPRIAPNSWVAKNRVYAYTIGNHDFYV